MKSLSISPNLNNTSENFLSGVVEGFYGRPWTTEQRKELFKRMKLMGMNTYLYAPKDDRKHRAFWRDLYSVEEAEHLKGLIDAAIEFNIDFIYAISPGLDVTFSGNKDSTILQRKLDQVQALGCSSFALLFDDIDPELSAADKEVFQSYGHAQVSITNDVYQSLSSPKNFLFCPTEYCATRAVPSVPASEYLNTLGSKLLPGIDIMWTGPKVVSRNISVESIKELSEVLRRPPVIWDNIHANDYDQKRLFLGPYKGRSPELIAHLKGVLTNPNCEFEANFIAMHTLAQWAHSSQETVQQDIMLSTSPVRRDIQLETEGEVDDDKCTMAYDPRRALNVALHDWLSYFYEEKYASPMVRPPAIAAAAAAAAAAVAAAAAANKVKADSLNAAVEAAVVETVNDVATDALITGDVQEAAAVAAVLETIEPMECSLVNSLAGSAVGTRSSTPVEGYPINNEDTTVSSMQVDTSPSDNTVTESEVSVEEQLTIEDLQLLTDLCYLPYEHGPQSVELLEEFHWLKCNAHVANQSGFNGESEPEAENWKLKAANFNEAVAKVSKLARKLSRVSNRALFYDLSPYVWDIRGVLSTLNAYVKWLALGQVPFLSVCFLRRYMTWCSVGYKDMFSGGDYEPWMFRGGFTAELQRMLPLESAQDLFPPRPPDISVCTRVYTIRMYSQRDKSQIYDVCGKSIGYTFGSTCHEDLPGDRFIGGFLHHSTEYCFVLEDESGVCAYCVAALDATKFRHTLLQDYIPLMRMKYPKSQNSLEKYFHDHEADTASIHADSSEQPLPVDERFPSILQLDALPGRGDESTALRRMLACVCAALKTNGSEGVHAVINPDDETTMEAYRAYGFSPVTSVNSNASNTSTAAIVRQSSGLTIVGRAI